jgi:hypothetical protein
LASTTRADSRPELSRLLGALDGVAERLEVVCEWLAVEVNPTVHTEGAMGHDHPLLWFPGCDQAADAAGAVELPGCSLSVCPACWESLRPAERIALTLLGRDVCERLAVGVDPRGAKTA